MKHFYEEVVFVGLKRKIPWFNKDLARNKTFARFVHDVCKEREGTSLRTILYSILPLVEYVASTEGVVLDRINDKKKWLHFIKEKEDVIRNLAIRYGTQGNVPQRAAIILDYLYEKKILPEEKGVVYELGCSAGFLGSVLCSPHRFFVEDGGALARRLFWLKRMPRVYEFHDVRYEGFDRVLPDPEIVPYYVWDEDRREQVKDFAQMKILKRVQLFECTFDKAFSRLKRNMPETAIILTSFMFYQLTDPVHLIEKILNEVSSGDVHWLDLSRNNGLECIFGESPTNNLIPNHVYLSHNGTPVAHIVNGSDDCPDWEYL